MTRPDPKSFDTLEKAQAEIARCYGVLDEALASAQLIEGLVKEITDARAEAQRLIAGAL